MTEIKVAAIKLLLQFLLGGKAFTLISNLVVVYMDKGMTNEAKRIAVKNKVYPYAKTAGKWLINTAIAFTVSRYKKEIGV